ncbi:sialidase family protein [Streptomyces sp. NPDC005538]|uniref:sialidase family protein n=1 Tax=unclassified Streptomyces TaxID=2593676 RepID=UPI0033AC63D1
MTAGTPDRANGQPVVEVNPRNPDNLVYASTDDIASGGTLVRVDCYAAFSTNGGRTWTRTAWPASDRPQCGDPYLAVDSKGIFYLAWNELACPDNPNGPVTGTCNGVPNALGVARSTDGGRTWSDAVNTPAARAGTPRLRVDTVTDAVYAVGASPVGVPGPTVVTVSRDHGLTWSPIEELPQQPFGNQIAVHSGVLATATAEAIVNGNSVAPINAVFQVSRDDGKTFTSFPLTDSQGSVVAPPSGDLVPDLRFLTSDPMPWVSADPTRTNRFALMLPRGDNLEVYVTNNAGRTWTGPTVVAAPGASKPWIDFGPKGSLGIMWRHVADGLVDTYSTVSFDGGRSFPRTVKVNRTSEPYAFVGTGGDEWSRILIHGKYAYVSWADARDGGDIDGIVARVPLSAYR